MCRQRVETPVLVGIPLTSMSSGGFHSSSRSSWKHDEQSVIKPDWLL